jgi:hypothetical protein
VAVQVSSERILKLAVSPCLVRVGHGLGAHCTSVIDDYGYTGHRDRAGASWWTGHDRHAPGRRQ